MVYTIVVHLYAKDDKDAIAKVSAKLREAALVYSRDRETLSWFVMQDTSDPRAFTIVERYENEDSQKYHLNNPYWQTFDKFVKPLLDKPMDLRRLEELLPKNTGLNARRGSIANQLEKHKVETDDEMWKKVDSHQLHMREQGNY